ncbi:MAG: RNA methyltransferase [Candidatus Anstonellaceae archaeon]
MSERFRVVLVEPEYQINVGAVARVMKNFGFSELFLVNPKCDYLGIDAIKHSKHAREILEKAQVKGSFEEAVTGCSIVAGTSGVLYRHWHKTLRLPLSLIQFKKLLSEKPHYKVALVFGNEGRGLSERDISSCDLLVTIPTNPDYPILNLSHAVAIVLYELSDLPYAGYNAAGEKEKKQLLQAFFSLVEHYKDSLRNPNKTKVAFRRMVGKAMLADKECAAVLGVIKRALRELEQ